jgi:hypothetical protein
LPDDRGSSSSSTLEPHACQRCISFEVVRRPLFALLLVLAACADERSAPAETTSDPPADVAVVICERGAIRLETPVVRAWEDGVHFRFENPGDAAEFSLHHRTWAYGTAEGGDLPGAASDGRSSIAPGHVLVACIPERLGSYSDPDAQKAVLEVVDPEGLYVPWDLACGSGRQFPMRLEAADKESVTEAFRRVPGVEPSDRFRRPLYPRSPLHWPTFIVFRDGQAVARIGAPGQGDEWELLVDACPGSGIEEP